MQWSGVGHTEQKEYLTRLLQKERLAHAYLFAGPDGIGKRMIAEDLMQTLVGSGPTLDILRLAPECDKNGTRHDIPVEAASNLRVWLALRPLGRHKTVLIDDADRLGGKTGDMLLKALEEPPVYAHFFLVTSRPGALRSTIVSRCERVDFRPLTDADLRTVLGKRKLDADDRELLAVVAAGSPGAALRLLEDKKLPIAAKAIASLQKALTGGMAERFLVAKTVAASDDADNILSWWLSFVHAKLAEKPSLAPVARGLLEASKAFGEIGINRRLALERFFLELD